MSGGAGLRMARRLDLTGRQCYQRLAEMSIDELRAELEREIPTPLRALALDLLERLNEA